MKRKRVTLRKNGVTLYTRGTSPQFLPKFHGQVGEWLKPADCKSAP